jgi:hypothetical protein
MTLGKEQFALNCAASKSKFLSVHCLTIGLLVTTSLPALAKVRKITVGSNRPGSSAIALDAQQRPHISYQSANYRLHHAWLEKLIRHDEVVDATSDCGWDSAIAVDSQGHVHISYHAKRTNQPVLGHAVFDGAQWRITDVAEGGYSTSIALDANERPRILHLGDGGFVLKYSTFDGVDWDTQDTGLSGLYFFPTELAFDAAGTAHITFTQRSGNDIATYATNHLGTWAPTGLVSQAGGNLNTALALDSLGRPHVAITLNDTVRYSRFDGVQWQNENVFEEPDVTQHPDSVALALDKNDRPHILFSTFVSIGEGGVNVAFYTYFDGVDWRGILLDRRNAGGVAIAVDTNRVVHGLYQLARGERATLQYARITLPDVTGDWALPNYVAAPDGVVVQTALTLRNLGTDTAKNARVAFYLSDDAVLDQGDEVLPFARRTGSVKPGVEKTLRVKFQHSGVVSGRYLIAVIDPEKARDDLDRPNNTIVVQLPPVP